MITIKFDNGILLTVNEHFMLTTIENGERVNVTAEEILHRPSTDNLIVLANSRPIEYSVKISAPCQYKIDFATIKHLPLDALYNTVQYREQLLERIMINYGMVRNKKEAIITIPCVRGIENEDLVKDIFTLVSELGYRPFIEHRQSFNTKTTNIKFNLSKSINNQQYTVVSVEETNRPLSSSSLQLKFTAR
jgi:hypothetical protein